MTETAAKNKIPTLSTERLMLRPFSFTDAAEVQRMAGNFKVAEMTATIPHPYPDGAAEAWIGNHGNNFANGDGVTWAVCDRHGGHLVGCVGFIVNKNHKKAEVGYWVGEEFWSKGYCTEAVVAGIAYCFKQFGLNKITSRHLSHNPASGKVMMKAGMTQEGILKQEFFRYGKFTDMVVFGLLRSEWEQKGL